jgi:hypothetical protein
MWRAAEIVARESACSGTKNKTMTKPGEHAARKSCNLDRERKRYHFPANARQGAWPQLGGFAPRFAERI